MKRGQEEEEEVFAVKDLFSGRLPDLPLQSIQNTLASAGLGTDDFGNSSLPVCCLGISVLYRFTSYNRRLGDSKRDLGNPEGSFKSVGSLHHMI